MFILARCIKIVMDEIVDRICRRRVKTGHATIKKFALADPMKENQ